MENGEKKNLIPEPENLKHAKSKIATKEYSG